MAQATVFYLGESLLAYILFDPWLKTLRPYLLKTVRPLTMPWCTPSPTCPLVKMSSTFSPLGSVSPGFIAVHPVHYHGRFRRLFRRCWRRPVEYAEVFRPSSGPTPCFGIIPSFRRLLGVSTDGGSRLIWAVPQGLLFGPFLSWKEVCHTLRIFGI